MSILAEPRRKQRLSVDPQNIQWKNDDQKISRKLMERMGWSDGDGLGRNRQGSANSVKLKANYTGKGLGADKLVSYDTAWIGCHDDFADLLSALNKNKEQKPETEEQKQQKAQRISLELNSKSLRRRIHYQKFTRAKDMTNYTENDRAAVLGIGLSRSKEDTPEKAKPCEVKVEEVESNSAVEISNTTVSTLSVAEYFASKMAALKAKREQAEGGVQVHVEVKTEETTTDKEDDRKVRKKKRKETRRLEEYMCCETPSETCKVEVEVFEEKEDVDDEEELRKLRKKEKKLKRRQEREQLAVEAEMKEAKSGDVNDCEADESSVKKLKRKTIQLDEGDGESAAMDGIVVQVKKKKSKGKKPTLEE